MNLHFDYEYDIYMSSKIYEEIGSDLFASIIRVVQF